MTHTVIDTQWPWILSLCSTHLLSLFLKKRENEETGGGGGGRGGGFGGGGGVGVGVGRMEGCREGKEKRNQSIKPVT